MGHPLAVYDWRKTSCRDGKMVLHRVTDASTPRLTAVWKFCKLVATEYAAVKKHPKWSTQRQHFYTNDFNRMWGNYSGWYFKWQVIPNFVDESLGKKAALHIQQMLLQFWNSALLGTITFALQGDWGLKIRKSKLNKYWRKTLTVVFRGK